MTITNRFSPVLLAVAGLTTICGVTAGAVEYIRRSPGAARHSPGTSAWTVHLLLSGLAVVWIAGAVALARRRRISLLALLTAPVGRQAAARLLAARGWHAITAAVLVTLLGYNLWRAGEQITAGLNPNFTANAWGGPTYLGAMFCHYLDLSLLSAAATVLLSRHVLPIHSGKSTQADPTGSLGGEHPSRRAAVI